MSMSEQTDKHDCILDEASSLLRFVYLNEEKPQIHVNRIFFFIISSFPSLTNSSILYHTMHMEERIEKTLFSEFFSNRLLNTQNTVVAVTIALPSMWREFYHCGTLVYELGIKSEQFRFGTSCDFKNELFVKPNVLSTRT